MQLGLARKASGTRIRGTVASDWAWYRLLIARPATTYRWSSLPQRDGDVVAANKSQSPCPGPAYLIPMYDHRTSQSFLALCCGGFPFCREDNGLRLTSGARMEVPRGTGPDIKLYASFGRSGINAFWRNEPNSGRMDELVSVANQLGTSLLRSDMAKANHGARESKTKKTRGGDRQLENE